MADQLMQCPQCGGELAVLNDDKRECQNCKTTYTVTTNLVPDKPPAADKAPVADKPPVAPQTGVPVKDRYNRCPRCRGELFMLSDGKRQCQSCKTKYVLMPRSAAVRTTAVAGDDAFDDEMESSGKKKKKKSTGAIIAVIVGLLLAAAAGVFLANQYLFDGNLVGELFGEDETAADTGQLAGEVTPGTEVTVPMVSTGEIAEGAELKKDEPLKAMGIVEEVGEDFVRLNNGVACYFDPDLLGEVQAVLGNIDMGGVVGITGVVSDPSPASFTLESCGVPYIYYDGQKFYNEYEDFRKGIPYPDTVYSEDSYQNFMSQVNSGDVSSGVVLDKFRVGDTVTEESFAYGVEFYDEYQAMSITGRVEKVAEGYFVVDGIYCFYERDLLSEEEQEAIDALQVGESVAVNGCVCNASADAFRMKYCCLTEQTPNDTPDDDEQAPSLDSLYKEAVRQAREYFLIYSDDDNDNITAAYVTSGYFDGGDLCYRFVDIDGNGVDEMLFEFVNYPGTIYAMYTICDNQLICLGQGFQSDRYSQTYVLCSDGRIAKRSTGVGYYAVDLYQFPSNGESLELTESFVHENENDYSYSGNEYYWYSTTNSMSDFDFDTHAGYSSISAEEFNNVSEKYATVTEGPHSLTPIDNYPDL